MAANNLIPTPIVDKNGVASIRHKRSEAARGSKSASVPAPSLSPVKSGVSPYKAALSEALRRVKDDEYVSHHFPNIDLLEKRMDKYPEKTLRMFNEMIEYKNLSDGIFCESLLASCLQNSLNGDDASYVVQIARQIGTQDDWSPSHHADFAYVDALRLYRGLKSINEEYDLGMTPNYSDLGENRGRFNALLNLSIFIFDGTSGDESVVEWVSGEDKKGDVDWDAGWILKSRYMLSHTARNPKMGKYFTDLFYERGVIDDAVLQQMVESDAPVLNDGLL